MSTKFYIKDENGIFLSTDGKIRYTMLKGKELYKFLKSENGKHRCFYVDFDDNGDKIGLEVDPKDSSDCSKQHERDKYIDRVKEELDITIVSASILVSTPGEDDIALTDTLVDEDEKADVELMAMRNMDLETLRAALKTLTEDEYKLIYDLYLARTPLTEQQIGDKIGMSQRGVSKRKYRILKKLKKFFCFLVLKPQIFPQ